MNQRNLLLIVATLVIIGGLFYLLSPRAKNSTSSNSPTTSQKAVEQNLKTFDLKIKDKKLAGDNVLKVTEGEEVVFRVESDESEELHLHGYDLALDLEAGKVKELKFKADKSGRFDFELEGSGTELGVLEVAPK